MLGGRMLCVNDGGQEVWIRVADKHDPFYRGTSGLQPIFLRCHQLTQERSRFDDGATVLAPTEEGTLEHAVISDSIDADRARGKRYAGTRVVVFEDTPMPLSVAEGRLVRSSGYFRRLLGVGFINGSPYEDGARCGGDGFATVWRSEVWTDGLFSMLFWALGFLESAAGGGAPSPSVATARRAPRHVRRRSSAS